MHRTGRVMTSVTLKGSITEYIRGHAIKKKAGNGGISCLVCDHDFVGNRDISVSSSS